MTRQKIYWICQITGWSVLCLYDLALYVLKNQVGYTLIINGLVNILMGILITHSYRLLVKRMSWLDLPLSRLIPRIFFSVVVMASLMALLNFPLDFYTIPNVHFNPFAFVFYLFNWMRNVVIWIMIYHVYQYFERSKNNEIEKIRLSSSVRDFESKLLRSQLNPHFVFNALNGIRGLVLENPEKAQQSITQLSRILRNSLVADRHKTVSLQEELKTVHDYLDLEKIRYEERLQVKTEIEPGTLSVQVPPMMVQTLVENAIKHGVSKPVNGGFVAIQAKMQSGQLHLLIRNTGRLSADNSENGTGFGLVSTQQRLALIYGEQKANFHIRQETDNIVCAELEIPLEVPN